jgi:hypothetical protein
VSVAVNATIAEARAAFLDLGGRDVAPLAAAIERLPEIPAFATMATASTASRPQWAGMLDDLFDRPALKAARAGLRNALASTLAGDSLYRNVFFSFVDAIVLWHYAHTGDRRSGPRIDVIYGVALALLQADDPLRTIPDPVEPDTAYFHRLRRIALARGDAYPLLRRAGRLLGTVEAAATAQKVSALRGSLLTSYITFSVQVIGMAKALRDGHSALAQEDVRLGLDVFLRLIETPPGALASAGSAAGSHPSRSS